ncbi:MAG TPA: efflux transporter outer membrane subunit [Steroidobacteraceae bacterium]|jgi:NodT family efflux transporter outer membrane factor (OMF) lipoprotein|nr:efflux transporter outer membrane subunit [Steroidobacteraceae bacterium]
MMRLVPRALCVGLGAALASACAVGPDYHRPQVDTAANYKESGDWKPSEPNDVLSRGPWWQIFNDEVLNDLEAQIDISNQNVKAAAAAFEQSRALVSQARAGFWPTIAASLGMQREGAPVGASNITGVPIGGSGSSTRTQNTFTGGVSANWDIDIWGKIRRNTESNVASAQASSAALAAARLSAQAELATDYFELRAQDQLQKLLDDTVVAETQSLHITESRYKFGVAARADVVTAETQLLSSQAQQVNAKIQRAILEHALAVLLGKQPAEFSLSVATMRSDVPTVPAGVPSTLLERRPDVAEAERSMASANAQIGVAKAGYFPDLTLSGQDQYSNSTFSRLFRDSNRIWAVGPTLAETLFDGGLVRAQVRSTRAAYEGTVDSYRQTVLAGFQQVEDQIVTLRVLEQEGVIEDETVKKAREAEVLTLNQYKAGTVPYSSVITAQTTRLAAEETALQVLSSRLQASVALIEALGGGWDASMATAK